MEEKSKHRLVGALVLLSLAIIFLPSLIYRDGPTQEIIVRPQVPIPPAPVIEPVVIAPPPAAPKLEMPSDSTSIFEPKEPEVQSQPTPSPRLTDQGVPEGWLIQVASLSLKKSAQVLVSRLKADQYSAYWESAQTEQGERFRVFVGPQIDKSRAEKLKSAIDKSYKVKSRLLRFNPSSGN